MTDITDMAWQSFRVHLGHRQMWVAAEAGLCCWAAALAAASLSTLSPATGLVASCARTVTRCAGMLDLAICISPLVKCQLMRYVERVICIRIHLRRTHACIQTTVEEKFSIAMLTECVSMKQWMRSQCCQRSIKIRNSGRRFIHHSMDGVLFRRPARWVCNEEQNRGTHIHLVRGAAAVLRLLARGDAQCLEGRIDAKGVGVKTLHGLLTLFRRLRM